MDEQDIQDKTFVIDPVHPEYPCEMEAAFYVAEAIPVSVRVGIATLAKLARNDRAARVAVIARPRSLWPKQSR
jgi:hypothetical protein